MSLLRDGRGRPTHVVTLVTDMSAHKRHEALQQALVHELNHRAKNSLALIQSVARQTAARSPSEFLPRFEQRLQAIAAAQDLLVRRDWREVTVRDLLASQLAHFGGVDERVDARGEEVAVTAAAAQTLGMAFHELATNAAKYGALSTEAGRIDVAWAVERGRDNEEMFRLEWVESGGPPVSAPDARGFGSALVERLVRSAFGGEVSTGSRGRAFVAARMPGLRASSGWADTTSAARRRGPAGVDNAPLTQSAADKTFALLRPRSVRAADFLHDLQDLPSGHDAASGRAVTPQDLREMTAGEPDPGQDAAGRRLQEQGFRGKTIGGLER